MQTWFKSAAAMALVSCVGIFVACYGGAAPALAYEAVDPESPDYDPYTDLDLTPEQRDPVNRALKITELENEYEGLEPKLKAARTSEDALEEVLGPVTEWRKEIQTWRLGYYFLTELGDVKVYLTDAFGQAISESSRECVQNKDPGEAAEIMSWAARAPYHGVMSQDSWAVEYRYRMCARFNLEFYSEVYTIPDRGGSFKSVVEGFVVLELGDDELGVWKGEVSTLTHVSLEGRGWGSGSCSIEFYGTDGQFWIPAARLDLIPPKEGEEGKSRKQGAMVIFAMDNVIREGIWITCPKMARQHIPVTNFTTVFGKLNERRLDNGGGLGFRFGDEEDWKTDRKAWLQLTVVDTDRVGDVDFTVSTTLYIYHFPMMPVAVGG